MTRATIGASLLIALAISLHPAIAASNGDAGDSSSTKDFVGIKFGVAVGVTIDTGGPSRVNEASVDTNGIVRVNTLANVRARVFLESHYFFGCFRNPNTGCGPFIALQPGNDQIIESIGLGFMVGFRRANDAKQSFNLGVGLDVDPSTKTLGYEFQENKPAPVDPTSGKPLPVRFQTRDKASVLLLASFSW